MARKAKTENMGSAIMDYRLVLSKFKNNTREKQRGKEIVYDINNDGVITTILSSLKEMYRYEIHENLAKDGSAESEAKIRGYVKDVITDLIPFIETKVKSLNARLGQAKSKLQKNKDKSLITSLTEKKEEIDNYLKLYIELYSAYMAIAAFRSYKHYCFYMETVFNFRLWRDTAECESGYFYYANKMMLDDDVNFMERQQPTGYGKTMGNCFMLSYIFGLNIDNDVLYVCGNDKFTEDVMNNTLKLMESKEYAAVFPYYAQFNGQRDMMFSFCAIKALKFAITGSKKSTNLRVVTKLSDCNGVRAKWLFLDDITQRRDMASLAMHNKDIHSFQHEWFERNYSRAMFKIVASGTTYSSFDLLSYLKSVFGGGRAVPSKLHKYTKISKQSYIHPDRYAVFICVPLLDPDTDESTYPAKITTFAAREKRKNSFREYMAMDNQTPLPPEENPFYFTQLRQYETLPKVGENGREEACWAALDPKRSGSDFISMPICSPMSDGHYVVDWLYDEKPMKDQYYFIVNKIQQHHITRLYIERNTDEGIAPYLEELLYQRGITFCKIEDIYNTMQKEKRIFNAEADIKSQMVFPKFGMYAPSSQVGKALQCVYTYSYNKKNEHDDAPDSLALYSSKFLNTNKRQYGSIMSFCR